MDMSEAAAEHTEAEPNAAASTDWMMLVVDDEPAVLILIAEILHDLANAVPGSHRSHRRGHRHSRNVLFVTGYVKNAAVGSGILGPWRCR